MKEASNPLERGRYRCEDGKVIIEVAVKNSNQLFNERDPAPFRDRDLDEDFVAYILSSVQEFPLKTEMKLRIAVQDESDHVVNKSDLLAAIRAHFAYQSRMTQAIMKKRLRVGRQFLVVGLLVLFACLGIAHFFGSVLKESAVGIIIREGFVIIGWVAMWRPVEVILYDWWPIREQRQYLEKIEAMAAEVICKFE